LKVREEEIIVASVQHAFESARLRVSQSRRRDWKLSLSRSVPYSRNIKTVLSVKKTKIVPVVGQEFLISGFPYTSIHILKYPFITGCSQPTVCNYPCISLEIDKVGPQIGPQVFWEELKLQFPSLYRWIWVRPACLCVFEWHKERVKPRATQWPLRGSAQIGSGLFPCSLIWPSDSNTPCYMSPYCEVILLSSHWKCRYL
jgi:hypothetical protein